MGRLYIIAGKEQGEEKHHKLCNILEVSYYHTYAPRFTVASLLFLELLIEIRH